MPPPKQQQKKNLQKTVKFPPYWPHTRVFLQLKTETLDLLMKFKKWVKKNVFFFD